MKPSNRDALALYTVMECLKERDNLRDECSRLRAELAEMRRDRERLDWCDAHGVPFSYHEPTLRAAIDAAMQPEAKEGQ